jgi:hypothetical protein
MNRLCASSAVITIALLILPGALAPAMASPFTGGTMGWTIIGQPSIVQLNGSPTGKVTFLNNVNTTTLGLVLLVLHNSVGQTVYITAGTANVASGANSTAYDVIYAVPSGTYTATFFAELPSGTAMSVPTTISITL